MVLLPLCLFACGDGDEPDPEADVRSAAADYLEAAILLDGNSACAKLSPGGRRGVVASAERARGFEDVATCEEVFAAVGPPGPVSERSARDLDDYIARVRSDEIRSLEVVVEDEDHGALRSVDGGAFELPVSRYGDAWLVDDGLDPLYGVGLDPLEPRG